MSRRSLNASKAGVMRARQALERRNLIQRSLVDENIAAWSTINNFFTGKPVARNIFLEICHRLDLDWEAIAEQPSIPETEAAENTTSAQAAEKLLATVEVETAALLQSVRQLSAAVREALTPRILERIPREIVREKYLPAIARGVEQKLPRIIPIIGPAGYGKSTILGDLYDQLSQSETAWIGLILCSSLVQTTCLADSLGSSLSGQTRSIVDITAELTAACGRGVLLINTLDLLIDRDFVPAFKQVLHQLLQVGVTIVFTCRDHEYDDYLEPTRERLAGLSQFVDRYKVPNFTTAEIRMAAETFFNRMEATTLEQGRSFADQILSLSADNRSLREIIENPLLLALLCELFAREGNIPSDLTVSKLYRRYWQEKIAYSRGEQRESGLVAIEKENLCLTIARTLFELSQEQLCESIHRDELGITFNQTITQAYNDLFSEGVIDLLLPSRKIHFFHQTLLEYAIAYWLTRHTAQAQRRQLFENLNQANGSLTKSYRLPVLRQLLTIVETEAEFEALISQLNAKDLGVFGVISMAAASRDRLDALRQLLPTALEQGEAYQKRLRQAFNMASQQLVESTWDVLLLLLETGAHATAGNTAQLVGELLSRWWQTLKVRLPSAIAAIQRRSPTLPMPKGFSQGDQALLAGWLLQPCLPLMEENPEPVLLEALHPYLAILGYRTCAAVIHLHRATEIPTQTQYTLLRQLLQEPVLNHESVERSLCAFVSQLIPSQATEGFPLGNSWSEILYSKQPAGWEIVQAKAIGRWAASDATRLAALLQNLLAGSPQLLHRSLIALTESLEFGGGAAIVGCLTQFQGEVPAAENLRCLNSLLMRCASFLTPEQHEALALWLRPLAQQQIERLHPILNLLADTASTARQTLEQCLADLSEIQQQQVRQQLLRFQPIEQHPALKDVDKVTQRLLLNSYRQKAASDPAFRDRLLEAAQSRLRDAALIASQDLDQVCGEALTPDHLLLLLQSIFPGVRVHALRAIIKLANRKDWLLSQHLSEVYRMLDLEENQTVLRLLCDLTTFWVRQGEAIPSGAMSLLAEIPDRLLKQKLFDGGTARSLMDTLKAIAQSPHPAVEPGQLGQAVRHLLKSIHLVQVRNSESEMIDLLCAVNRLDGQFLRPVVQQDAAIMVRKGWNRNLSAIVKTVCRIEGSHSALLDEILSTDWCTPETRNIILEVRGG